MRCYLFDIDGTLADLSHRLPHIQKEPKDWDAFFDACDSDSPIFHMIDVAKALSIGGNNLVFVSGRAERCREKTLTWLQRFFPELIWSDDSRCDLYMRKDGDHRPDNIIKSELLDQILADGYRPIMAFDDRTQVVEMWRARGIPCAQVAAGDF